MKVKSESEGAQLCLTRSDLMGCSLPGSSVHGILQARVLEWGYSKDICAIWQGVVCILGQASVCFGNLAFGIPGGSVVKKPPVNAGNVGSIPESGSSPRERNGKSLQIFLLGESNAQTILRARVHGVTDRHY